MHIHCHWSIVTVATQRLLIYITRHTHHRQHTGLAIAVGLSADCGISSLAGATVTPQVWNVMARRQNVAVLL